jgi:hypothetical protein
MLYYIIPYIHILFFTLYFYKKYRNSKELYYLLVFLILPAFFIVVLRGDVGTDTYNYLNFFRDYRLNGFSYTTFEPGFEFLGWFFSLINLNERVSIALISTSTTFILCKLFSRSREEMLIFGLILFPIYYVDFTMNTLRYGLAFTLSAISIDELYNKKYRKSLLFALISILFHYSSVLVIAPFLMNYLKKRYWAIIILFVGSFILFFSDLFDLLMFYLDSKEAAYSLYYSPTPFSGAAPLILVILLYFNYIINTNKEERKSLIHLILIAEICSFVVARFSYAGLRFQSAFLFTMIIFLKNNWQFINNKKRNAEIFLLISFIAFAFFLKNVYSDTSGESPFNPYTFFWHE